MKKTLIILLYFFCIQGLNNEALASKSKTLQQHDEVFANAETNFNLVMKKLLENSINKNLTKAELYKAATSGMLTSLNKDEKAWNKLLSPTEFKELKEDLSGKVSGIGIELKFFDQLGIGQILRVLPHTPASKAGLKKNDQILSVNGKVFKDKTFQDLVFAIRGKIGESITLKILRADQILSINVKRDVIPWTPVELQKLDPSTHLLTIGYFNEKTPKLVEETIKEINSTKSTKLIVDLRDNSGGGLDQAIEVTDLFLQKGHTIAKIKNREGKVEVFKSKKGLINGEIQIVILTSKTTSSGAELFTAALKENKNAKTVGENTFGKWNAQIIETLPNNFAIKYTIKEFQSPNGHSYQDDGIKPDLEVVLPTELSTRELWFTENISTRLALDSQLRAAYELVKSF